MNSVKLQDKKLTFKNQYHFYTPATNSEKEIKKLIPFTTASKTIKYLGTNLTKGVKDIYSENYKILREKKKSKKTQINGKISCVHELEELILLKCQYNQKSSRDSMQSLSRCQ